MSNYKCNKCGEVLADGEMFCSGCGSSREEILSAYLDDKPETSTPSEMSDLEGGQALNNNNVMGDLTGTKITTGTYTSNQAVDNSSSVTSTVNDNSNTQNTVYNQTILDDDTKKSVECEISGRKILLINSVKCLKCGRVISPNYYNESKRRCSICEKEAEESYKSYYKELAGAGVIDSSKRAQLDRKAEEVNIDSAKKDEIEQKIKSSSKKQLSESLSELKQKEFDREIQQMANGRVDVKAAFAKIEAIRKTTLDENVLYWYYLLQSIVSPSKYLTDLKSSSVDIYWQQYWAFLAAVNNKNISESLDIIDELRSKYPDYSNDITLAQAIIQIIRFFQTGDESYIADAKDDVNNIYSLDSYQLNSIHSVMGVMMLGKNDGMLDNTGMFILINVLKGGKYMQEKQEAARRAEAQAAAAQRVAAESRQREQQAKKDKAFVLNDTAGAPLDLEDHSRPKRGGSKMKNIIILAAIVIAGVIIVPMFLSKGDDNAKDAVENAVKKDAKAISNEAEKVKDAAVNAGKAASTSAPVNAVKESINKAEEAVVKKSMADRKSDAVKATSSAVSNAAKELLDKGNKAYAAKNYSGAISLYKRAANAGSADACEKLADIYATGVGAIAKNSLQESIWRKKADKLK